MGRLLQKGWRLCPGATETGVQLHAPDAQCMIPLYFRKISLALYGTINRVQQGPDEQQGRFPALKHKDDNDVLVVQTVMKLHDFFWDSYGLRAWKTGPDGNPFKFNYFENAQLMWNINWWSMRSTLICKADDSWELVEHCCRYFTLEDSESEIPECNGEETQVLTVLHKSKEPIKFFGTVIGEMTATSGGVNVEGEEFRFSGEPPVPYELQHKNETTMEKVEQQDPSVSWEGPIPVLEDRESLVVNGFDLNVNSSLALLRGAAEYLGLNKGGSKKALWNRLNQKVQQMEHEELFLAANKFYQEEARNRGAIQVHVPRQPSQEERELHELTHLPYRDWCDFCIATKARDDNQKVLNHSVEGRRNISSVQLDYAYGRSGGNGKADLTTILVGIDSETRIVMVLAVPVDGKGADLRGPAEHVVKFTLMLNQYGNVEVIGDNEPTMRKLLTYIQTIRHSLGLQTTITNSSEERPDKSG